MESDDAAFDDLIEKSSLGTPGARQLRARTSQYHADVVRQIIKLRNDMAHGSREEIAAAADTLLQLFEDLGYADQVQRVLAEAFPGQEAETALTTARLNADRRQARLAEDPAALMADIQQAARGNEWVEDNLALTVATRTLPRRQAEITAGAIESNSGLPSIPAVDWWITSRCDPACDFCHGPTPGPGQPASRDQICRAIAASATPVVTFCGGEPLLVRKISLYAAALKNRGKSVVLNTNGQLLTRLVSRKVPQARRLRLENFTTIGISLDGSTPEMHQAMRGGKADFHQVLHAARQVRYHPFTKLKIGTVVSSVNRDDLPELAWLVRNLKPDVWRLHQYSRRGGQDSGHQRHWISDQDFLKVAEQAADLAPGVRTVASTEAETVGCLIVDQAGNVLQPSGGQYIKHGNLLKEPLDRIWEQMPPAARKQITDNKSWLQYRLNPLS